MKQKTLQLSLLLMLLIAAFESKAQITITADNFPRGTTFIDTVHSSVPAALTLPTEGADQVWDYTNLTTDEIFEIEHFDATNDPYIPGALNVRIADLIFQGFIIESDAYEALDAEGWYDLGRATFDASYSITAITGGPNDTLAFPGVDQIFEGRINLIPFPLNYEDHWEQSRIERIPFELTVAAFGLDHTPGERQRIVTNDREVVGHGTLMLPPVGGVPTAGMDVLLIKRIETRLDSVFLGGAPAPAVLLDAFGLIQGSSTTTTNYLFYKADFAAPIISQQIGDDFLFYRPQSASIVSSTHDLTLPALNHFPNPASANQTVEITLNDPIANGTISITDITGGQIFMGGLDPGLNETVQFKIPATLQQGLYFYTIRDEKAVPVGVGKLQIN